MAELALCLAAAYFSPVSSKAAEQKGSGGPWIATVTIMRNEEQPGYGVYLGYGLIITAAHLTAVEAEMSVASRAERCRDGFKARLSRGYRLEYIVG